MFLILLFFIKIKNISLESFSCSFLFLTKEKIILANIGSCQVKKEQFNKYSNKWECISLNDEIINNKYKDKIILTDNSGYKSELEIKIFPYNDKDKFFVMGNSTFWETFCSGDLTIIGTDYYNENSLGAINQLYYWYDEILKVTSNMDGISVVLLFLK